jgi:dTDP-4-amino-4,6-dideoxygalactose transaminase
MSRIYLSAPDVRGAERTLVLEAIESNWVAPAGPALDAFEREVAAVSGVPEAVGLSSGTAALHLALILAGVGSGDEVLVPTFTFVATANAVGYVGATPVFIDSDPRSWCVSPELVAEELHERARRGCLPAALITVDLYGHCADYDLLLATCAEYEIPIIEDAAEALGAAYRDRPAGSFGTFGVVSFNGNKIITASSGGMLLCHDETSAARARKLSTQAREAAPHYEHLEAGFNYRLSNLLAAFGRGQLQALPERIERRRQINNRYRSALADVPGVTFLDPPGYGTSNYWLTCLTLDPSVTIDRETVRQGLEATDIESRPTWKPMHLQPLFATAPARIDGTAARVFDRGLCLPSGSGMSDSDLDRVIEGLESLLMGGVVCK